VIRLTPTRVGYLLGDDTTPTCTSPWFKSGKFKNTLVPVRDNTCATQFLPVRLRKQSEVKLTTGENISDNHENIV
jgi:hypothetical protein